MPRSVQKVGALARAEFTVYDSTDAPVTGLLNSDFTKLLSLDGVPDATVVTVAEITNGRYEATFTPPVAGDWYLLIRQTAYNPRGWDESFDVNRAGSDIFSYVIDGYQLAQILESIGAMLLGEVSGGPGSPVFKSMDGLATRVAMVADSNGNRSSVVITP